MAIEDLSGKVADHGNNPIPNAKISIFRKIGEVLTNENGEYSNIEISDKDEYLVQCTKDEYYNDSKDYTTEISNFSLMKKNEFEPPLPENIQVLDPQDGNSIAINWSEVVNFDFIAGYNIYRSDEIQGIFERINNDLITENSYSDSDIETFKKYYYMLEVVSANNPTTKGITSISQVIGPIEIFPVSDGLVDITGMVKKIKVDSTKTNRTSDKVFNNGSGDDTWWESQNGNGAWLEIILNEKIGINGFYFRRPFIGKGVLFATLQYWNYDINNWSNIQNLNFFIAKDYIFKDFMVNTDRIRLYVNEAEPLSEAQISKIVVYGG